MAQNEDSFYKFSNRNSNWLTKIDSSRYRDWRFNRVVRFVYKEGDMYKGLKDFITVAQSRDYYRPFDEIRIRRMLCDMLTQ